MESLQSDLEERVRALKTDLKTYGKEINAYLSSLFSTVPLGPHVDLRKDPRSILPILRQDLNDISLTRKQFISFESDKDIDEANHLLTVLSNVSQASFSLMKCDEKINGFDISATCKAFVTAQEEISKLPIIAKEFDDRNINKYLKREFVTLKSRFVSKLKRLLSACVTFEPGKITVKRFVTGFINSEEAVLETPVSLVDIWCALHDLDSMETASQTIVNELWLFILQPLWKEKRPVTAILNSHTEHAELLFDSIYRNQDLILKATMESQDTDSAAVFANRYNLGGSKMPLSAFLEAIGQVLTFVWSELYCGNSDFRESLFQELFTTDQKNGSVSIVESIQEAIIAGIPKIESDLPAYQKQVDKITKDFEMKLTKLGFLPLSSLSKTKAKTSIKKHLEGLNMTDKPFSSIIENVTALFAESRRADILARARELVFSDYHNSMLASGDALEDDPSSAGIVGDSRALLEQSGSFAMQVLRFEPCQVSLASCRLLKLIHDVMKQAVGSSAGVAQILFLTCRDCIDLFISVVTMKYAHVITMEPRMGAVFFNDCIYIAHNATLITQCYRNDFAKLHETLSLSLALVDLIPRLREIGGQIMTKHVEENKAKLIQLVLRTNICTKGKEESTNSLPVSRSTTPNRSNSRGKSRSSSDRTMSPIASHSSNMMQPSTPMTFQGNNNNNINNNELFGNENNNNSNNTNNNNTTTNNCINDDETAKQIVRHFDRLKGQWQGVLQESSYERCMGHLLDCVLRAVMQPVMESDRISEKSASDISRLMKTLQACQHVFDFDESENETKIDKIVTSWPRFVALSDLLEYSLSDIIEWLPRRKFSCFSGQQLTNLIKANFEDSAKRQSLINSIMEMSSS